ncbi:MAG: helix-turn-helix domain-containing protein [Sphingomonadaceae bacterium]
MVEGPVPDGDLFPQNTGDRLRAAREKANLDLNDIATKTRVPLRHLEAIERSDYAALPSPTYALGFSRAYARAVGLEEVPLIRRLREELGREDPDVRNQTPYEPTDPSRLPSRLLAWTALALAVLFAIGYMVWRSQYLGSDTGVPPIATVAPADEAPPATPTATAPPEPAPTGDVVLTATSTVWMRITDASGRRLFEKELAQGERFAVPPDAVEPRILTGRPNALRVTVGGREVAPLGPPDRTVNNVVITADALAARPAAPSGATTAPTPTP